MASGRIVGKQKKTSSNLYYYYQRSYRVKLDSTIEGKHRGSGPSKVVTEEAYLGTAEQVLSKCSEGDSPKEIMTKDFGLECAALATIRELDLIRIIDRHVSKRHQGLSVGQYLAIAAINRICKPTSRSGLAGWFAKTVLPEKMEVDPRLLKSQNFWDAFDKMISEKEVKQTKKTSVNSNEDINILDDSVILDIEQDIWEHLLTIHGVHLDPILYDTTNFYTFLEPTTQSELCQYCKSKDGKSSNRCVGLAIGLTKPEGFPLFHMLYPGNCHDAKLFPEAIRVLTTRFSQLMRTVEGLRLVIDKGNNSQTNIQNVAVQHRMIVIGSLVPSQNMDLMKKNLKSYKYSYEDMPAYREERDVFGVPSSVVVTFNPKLKYKKLIRFKKNLAELEQKIRETFRLHYMKSTKQTLESRIRKVMSGYKEASCLTVEIQGRRFKTLHIVKNNAKTREKLQLMGKTIMFSTDSRMSVQEIVDEYHGRNDIEDVFKLEKDPAGIPFRPIHCWTDSKIRVYAFICVIALLIWRLMQFKLRKAGLVMSDHVLKMELNDIREIVIMYSPARVEHQIVKLSKVQEQILSILGVNSYLPNPL